VGWGDAYIKETPCYTAAKFTFNIYITGNNNTITELAEYVSLSQSNKSDQNILCLYYI